MKQQQANQQSVAASTLPMTNTIKRSLEPPSSEPASNSVKSNKMKKNKKLGNRPTLCGRQKIEMSKAFGYFDMRGVGIIESRGLTLALRALHFEPNDLQIDTLISDVLGTKHGTQIDFKGFYKLMETKMLEEDTKEDVFKAYTLFIDEELGVITLDNLVAIARELGEDLPAEEIQEMITFADVKGTGDVDFEEFRKILQRPELE